MPKRTDIKSILVIGSGPIIIGQASEFDYSGTQAVKVLREHGFRVILVNSNPATIMTDPEFADATYVEPITAPVVEKILRKERPDAVLPTLGGQTALNVTMELAEAKVFHELDIELIGASLEAISAAEDRGRFKRIMVAAGMETAKSHYVNSLDEGRTAVRDLGYPVMVRPSYILGGGGTGIAHDEGEFDKMLQIGIDTSPVGEVLIEESIYGWKEFELEVMRDGANNAVIVCSIENFDPMGIHTGDSITVAPVMTLSDREYQEMRDDAIACLRAIGVETGGSNVQFAVDPATGRRLIVEMNPRVSRSSALASKATGFPIAKIAAMLAVGFTLDEIANDITGATPASFEPALDYVVVKAPRFDFAKFPSVESALGTSMQSVGEAMAIGRTFPEALQKALRSLESGRHGLGADPAEAAQRDLSDEELADRVAVPSPNRVFEVAEAMRRGMPPEDLAAGTYIDPWFLDQMAQLVDIRKQLESSGPSTIMLREAKRFGYSDQQLSYLWDVSPDEVSRMRREHGPDVTYKTVDTCAAEFEARTPYFYSTYEDESEAPEPGERTVMVLGSGPNRIGQGIEFDYCCVHAAFALADAGYETVMVNCNPETVSTDYDTSTRLYFEPLTTEDVLAVVEAEQPIAVIVQLGGQTPLGLAHDLEQAGVRIAGTSPDSIDMAEDRERFSALCSECGIRQPQHGTAKSIPEALEVVDDIGFPAVVRPSYVLGGRAMRIIYSVEDLSAYLADLYGATPGGEVDLSESPLLIDRFLESAIEVDVDAVFDGEDIYIGGIMEHVEEAGVHSGDSACVVPPPTLSERIIEHVIADTLKLARGLNVVGLVNIQFAIRGEEVYVLEANPRASRTVPFVSKATGVPLAKVATRVMMGEKLSELRRSGLVPQSAIELPYTAVKEAVLPWTRFPNEDTLLGPEMRATGEVMGVGPTVAIAYSKALSGAGHSIPEEGSAFISLADRDKAAGVVCARLLIELGFKLFATHGTAGHLARNGIPSTHVDKVGEGSYDPVRLIEDGRIDLIVNTPVGGKARGDGRVIRRAATRHGIPCITTAQGGLAVVESIAAARTEDIEVTSIQDLHASAGLR
ncbi:MAG: carbamoyl-phosphate synthase large subunit [Acidimicrobiia bacterium]|nr:MAG: carbamoyl-phosphate synthase large subunit [Acidimicrobiia bacterium]